MSARVWLWIALFLIGSASVRAQAYHSEQTPVVQGNAFLLRQNEWQLGPLHADYGVLRQLQLSTYVAPWLVLFPNLQVKVLAFQNERWAVSLRPGFYYADFSLPRKLYGIGPEADIRLWVVPIEAYTSVVIRRRFMLTMAGVFNYVTGKGSYDPQDFRGTAAASNAQLGLGWQWQINNVTALILQGRLILYQQAGGTGTVNVSVDEQTDAEVSASSEPASFNRQKGFSVSAAMFFSWRHTNFRVGVGYGNYSVPGLNLVVPDKLPFPVLDLFWRFGARHQPRASLP